MNRRSIGLLVLAAILVVVAPLALAASSIRPSWPTRIQWSSSVKLAREGSVSPSKAAATMRRTPASRAPRAARRG